MPVLQNYCVGIDVSKDKFDVCMMAGYDDRSTKIKASTKFDNTPVGIETFYAWVQRHRKETELPIYFVMEVTGVYYEELAWYLFLQGDNVAVESPKQIKHFAGSMGVKSKNDLIDAKVIATYGLSKKLSWWKPLSSQIYGLRLLTRQRNTFMQQKTQLLNQLHALQYASVHYQNDWMQEKIRTQVKHLEDQIEAFEQEMDNLVAKDEKLAKKVADLTTIPGIGKITVYILIAETNGFALINNQKQLTSYAGYDVKENQSGKKAGKTTISKQGNSRIRACLYLPALSAVRYNELLNNLQLRIYERTRIKMKGYVAVQRKLLCLTYILWKNNTTFDPKYLQNKTTNDQKTIVEKQDASLPEIVSTETSPLSNAKITKNC